MENEQSIFLNLFQDSQWGGVDIDTNNHVG